MIGRLIAAKGGQVAHTIDKKKQKVLTTLNYLDVLSNLCTFSNTHPTLLNCGVLTALVEYSCRTQGGTNGLVGRTIMRIMMSFMTSQALVRTNEVEAYVLALVSIFEGMS